MGTVEKRDKHKKRRFVSPEEKLERELKDCMHCRFFWGHNNRCANGTCCKPSKKKEQKLPTECVGCPYYHGKDKGENVYIDSLTYEQFMMLGDAELSRRFSMQDEAEQKAKIDREQANELEYVDESQKSDAAESANTSNGSAGAKPVRNPEREKPKWEDTITNRMLHWSYTLEQKEEVKKALAAGVPKATILTYFYPEVTVEKMSSYRMKQ